jgi:hypothetical protein
MASITSFLDGTSLPARRRSLSSASGHVCTITSGQTWRASTKLVDCPIAGKDDRRSCSGGAAHGLIPLHHRDTPMRSAIRPMEQGLRVRSKRSVRRLLSKPRARGVASVINLLESPRR